LVRQVLQTVHQFTNPQHPRQPPWPNGAFSLAEWGVVDAKAHFGCSVRPPRL
jgi:hypothetical protein